MNKRSAYNEPNISDYFFAVYPLCIEFQRDYRTPFQLNFEKSLQIISKYTTPANSFKKQEPAYFDPPQQIQHFKIQNDKNLDYQWSLYIKRLDISSNNEEFVEGSKVNLKNQINEHKQNKKSCFESTVQFNRMKCSLTYLLIIGNSNANVLSIAQKYLSDFKNVALTNDSKLGTASPQTISQLQKKEEEPKSNEKIKPKSPKVEQKDSNVNIEGDFGQEESPAIQIFVNKSPTHERQQKPEIYHNTKKQSQISNELDPAEESNIKLSTSDLEIGNQIEEQIMISAKNEPTINLPAEPVLPSSLTTDQSEEKTIQMTSSQLLNERGEVITVPFYKKKGFLLVFVIIILLAGGAFLMTRRISSSIGEKQPLEKGKNRLKQSTKKQKPRQEKDKKKEQPRVSKNKRK